MDGVNDGVSQCNETESDNPPTECTVIKMCVVTRCGNNTAKGRVGDVSLVLCRKYCNYIYAFCNNTISTLMIHIMNS